MFAKGDRVKVISIEKGVSDEFINRIGTITKVDEKQYYKYYIEFEEISLCDSARYLWWAEDNLQESKDEIDDGNPKHLSKALCLRCNSPMQYLKEYRFDSQDNNRGVFAAIFDYEEHLIFRIYVCSKCRHTEFFYVGKREGLDDWVDL